MTPKQFLSEYFAPHPPHHSTNAVLIFILILLLLEAKLGEVWKKFFFVFGTTARQWAMASSFTRFLDHTLGLLRTSDQLVAQTST